LWLQPGFAANARRIELTAPDAFEKRPVWQTRIAFVGMVTGFAVLALFGSRYGRFYGQTALVSAALALVLLSLTWVDLDRFLLPDVLTLPLIAGGVAYSSLFGAGLWLSLAGALVGYSIVAGLALYWRRRFGREGIGLGDAKLLAGGGAWIGLFGVPLILLFASGSALLVVALVALFGRRLDGKSVLAFGPMLALAIWAVWCLPFLVP